MIASDFFASRAFLLAISCLVSSTGFAGLLPTVSVTQVVAETSESGGSPPAVYTFTRTGSTAQQLRVYFEAEPDSPAQGNDWSSDQIINVNGRRAIFFPAGESTYNAEITADPDNIVEGPEALTQRIRTDSNYTIAAGSEIVFSTTLLDDPPVVSIALDSDPIVEDGAPGSMTITRSGGDITDSLGVQVFFNAGVAAKGSDFDVEGVSSGAQRLVIIDDDQTSETRAILPETDNLVEGDELITFEVVSSTSSSNNYLIGTATGSTTLTDDPPIVTLALEPDSLVEGDPPGSLTLTRSGGDLTEELGIRVAFDRGTAVNGQDFNVEGVNNNPDLVIIPGDETSEIREVVPNADALIEGDETIGLEVLPSNSSNYSYLIANATDSILLIDDVATVSIEAIDAEASEIGDPGLFRVTRSGGNEGSQLFVYFTLSGSANGPGSPPVDYDIDELSNNVNGRFVLMAAGQLAYDIPVEPRFDDLDEPAETVILTIRDDIGQYLVDESQPSATVTIETVHYLIFSDRFE